MNSSVEQSNFILEVLRRNFDLIVKKSESDYKLAIASFSERKNIYRLIYTSTQFERNIEIILDCNDASGKINLYVKKINESKIGFWYLNIADYLLIKEKRENSYELFLLKHYPGQTIEQKIDNLFLWLSKTIEVNLKGILFGGDWANVNFDWGNYK